MEFDAACPVCGFATRLPDEAPGRSFACLRCGAALVTADGGKLVAQNSAAHSSIPPPVNPFADLPQGIADPRGYGANPYAPSAFAPQYLPIPMTRDGALAKVQGPAVLMQIMGGLVAIAAVAPLLLLLTPDARHDEVLLVMIAIAAPLGLAVGGFTFYCGGLLKALRSYALVMTGVVLLLAVGFLICPFAALPGIWPLVVLLDPGVRQHFQTPQLQGQSPFAPS